MYNDFTANSSLPSHTEEYQIFWWDGDYTGAIVRDYFPMVGDGEFGGDFKPSPRYAGKPGESAEDIARTQHMMGSRTSMRVEQMKARSYCESLAGFGDGPITIRVDWSALQPGLFTWKRTNNKRQEGQGWSMENTLIRPGAVYDNTKDSHDVNGLWWNEERQVLKDSSGIPVDLSTVGR